MPEKKVLTLGSIPLVFDKQDWHGNLKRIGQRYVFHDYCKSRSMNNIAIEKSEIRFAQGDIPENKDTDSIFYSSKGGLTDLIFMIKVLRFLDSAIMPANDAA